jgi:hypothetical protein
MFGDRVEADRRFFTTKDTKEAQKESAGSRRAEKDTSDARAGFIWRPPSG